MNLRARIGNLEQRVKPERERPKVALPLFGPEDPLRPDTACPELELLECWPEGERA